VRIYGGWKEKVGGGGQGQGQGQGLAAAALALTGVQGFEVLKLYHLPVLFLKRVELPPLHLTHQPRRQLLPVQATGK
jgi:hypothetical protein